MEDNKTKKTVDKLKTPDEIRKIAELKSSASGDVKRIAARYEKGEIRSTVFEAAYRATRDPNKMKRDDYKNFVKSLAKGKFPDQGRFALKFLAALEAGKHEKKEAQELLKIWAVDADGAISKSKEKNALKKLNEAREQDTTEQTRETTESSASTIIQQADTRSAIENAGKVQTKNWRIPEAPHGVIEKLDKLEIRQYQLARDANLKDQQLEAERAKANPDPTLIKKLSRELAAIDDEINSLREEAGEVEKPWLDYLGEAVNQFKAIETFARRSGLDMDTIQKIKFWYLHEVKEHQSVKLKGLKVDLASGKAQKDFGTIQIKGIRFEKDQDDELEPDSPGKLYIDIVDADGRPAELTYKNFIRFVDGTEAHEQIDSLEAFQQKVSEETQYQNLAVGQTYEAKTLVEVNQNGENVYQTDEFTIEKIEERNGQQVVVLNRSVVKTPKNWLANVVDDRLYFDRKQSEFSLGEFARLLRQHNYKRRIQPAEMQDVLDAREKLRSGKNGDFENGSLTLPSGTSTSNVVFLDEYGQKRQATLKKEGDDYVLEYPATGNSGEWGAPNMPNLMPPPPVRSGSPKILKKKLPARSLMEMNNKDQIRNNPAEEAEMFEQPPQQYEGPKDDSAPAAEKKEKINKIYEEALPYDAIHKVGGMNREERSFFKSLWTQSRFLSVGDLWEMGKMMWEYYKRRFERRQKDRIGTVGKNLPFFAPEMQRITQAAENEQVNQFKESFDQFGVFQVQDRLKGTRNRDEFKASLITLTDKGQMRWDDIDFWRNLNRFVDPSLAIPIPSNGDPYTQLSEKDSRTGLDLLKPAIDSLWGEGQYNDWYAKNKSTYTSNFRNFYEEGSELEGIEGGHKKKLSQLLKRHMEGEFVNPHEYEGLIHHAIENGKSSMQAKLYFMIAGVAKENSSGHTILSFDRIAHINATHLARFPMLEYITASVKRGPTGEKSHRYTLDDYKSWLKFFDDGKIENTEPTQKVDDFMWKYIAPSDELENRINKAMRSAEGIDHEDMYLYVPPAGTDIVTNICRSQAGSRKFLSVEGYANAFPGYSQYMYSTAKYGNKTKLRDAIKSYVRFEGIMTDRFEKEEKDYQRLSPDNLKKPPIVSDIPPINYIQQMNHMVKQVINAYDGVPGSKELKEITTLIYDTPVGDISQKEEKEKQNRINFAFKKFDNAFNKVIKSDNGAKMRTIVAQTGLYGMPFTTDAEKDRKKAEISNELSLE